MKTIKFVCKSILFFTTIALQHSAALAQTMPEITHESFCSEFIAAKNGAYNGVTGASYNLGNIFTIAFAPSRIVKIQKIENTPDDASTADSLGEKVIFIMLPNPEISDADNAKVKEFIELARAFNKLKSMMMIRTMRNLTQEKCVNVLKKYESEFPAIKKTLEFQITNTALLERKKDSNAYRQFPKYLEKFTKKGWSIAQVQNYAEMFSTLQTNKKITEIMLILHEGSEYDSEKKTMVSTQMIFDGRMNQIPKKAFYALPNNIQKVILMSCQADQVIQWYEIDQASKNFDFYYAVPRKQFQKQLIGRFPVIARNAFLKAANAEVTTRNKSERSCVLQIESKTDKAVANIRFNGDFIGALSPLKTEIQFDCNQIKSDRNKVVVSYLGDPGNGPKSSLQISSMKVILSSGKTVDLEVKETFKISNPAEHYETVGTFSVGSLKELTKN